MKNTSIQCCFARHEIKYRLTKAQQTALREAIASHMTPDAHPNYTISNLYYDNDNFSMIRASLDKPDYKEKLRLRSYGLVGDGDTVFLEMKKKYDGVVFKRRIVLKAGEAMDYLENRARPEKESQILREIDALRFFYAPEPKVYIAYDREAWAGTEDPELRLTFDTNLRWRKDALDLRADAPTALILPQDAVLMEIKTPDTIPLWLVRALEANAVRQTSFSKYGACFREHFLPALAEKQRRSVLQETKQTGQAIRFPIRTDGGSAVRYA